MTARARFVTLDTLWRATAPTRDIRAALDALGAAVAVDEREIDRLHRRVASLELDAAIGRAARLSAAHGAAEVLAAAHQISALPEQAPNPPSDAPGSAGANTDSHPAAVVGVVAASGRAGET